MSSPVRGSLGLHSRANLYCLQCESHLGVFENEWIRLTSSYARPKEAGTNFATDISTKTQIVPSGQRIAEGCSMADVSCKKCAITVGQYCKSAPDADKRYLV